MNSGKIDPYYQDNGITIYHGDCREILPHLIFDTMVVDPVWPNNKIKEFKDINPYELFNQMLSSILFPIKRMAVQLGCDSNPDILENIDLDFFRVCWLEYLVPSYKGRLLFTGDIGYLYGIPPKVRPKRRLIPGKVLSNLHNKKESKHPTPRHLSHVRWLVDVWSEESDVIVDPFGGGDDYTLGGKATRPKSYWY